MINMIIIVGPFEQHLLAFHIHHIALHHKPAHPHGILLGRGTMQCEQMTVLQIIRAHRKAEQPHLALGVGGHVTQRGHLTRLGIPTLHAAGKLHKHNVAIGQHLKLDRVTAAAHQHLALEPAGIVFLRHCRPSQQQRTQGKDQLFHGFRI